MDTIAFQCAACKGDFELDITHFLERPTALKCSHCGAKPTSNRSHSLAQALDDLLSAMAAVRRKVQFELQLDSDALPPPYGPTEEEEQSGTMLDEDEMDDDDEEFEDDFDDEDDIFEDEDDDDSNF